MTSISTFATKTPEGWYYVNVVGVTPPGQWFNIDHVIRMIANGRGGTTLVFDDGITLDVVEVLPAPAPTTLPAAEEPI